MNECEKYREMMSAMLDGELDAAESERLIAHLSLCAECRELYELLSSVTGAEVWELPEVPEGLHEHIMSGVKSAASVRKKEGIMRKFRPWAVAAACLVVIVGVIFGVPRVFRMGSSGSGAFNTTASANSNSAPAAAQDNAGIDTAAPAEAPAGNAGPDQNMPADGVSDSAYGYATSEGGSPEAAPVPEPEAEAVPEQADEPALELDIESSVVTVESGGKSVSKNLNRNDTLIWLRAVIDGTAGDGIVAAKLEVSRSEGADYEVYFYHDGGKLMGSLTEDLEDAIVLEKLADFAQFEEMVDAEE